MKKTAFVILGLVFSIASEAQIDRVWNEQVYSGNQQSEKHSIWADFGYEISSNHLKKDIINSVFTGATITRATTEYTRDWPAAKPFLLNAETESLISYRSKLNGNWRLTASAGFKEQAAVRSTTDFVGLLLNGNADYQNQTLKLGQTTATYSGRQFVKLGGEYLFEKTLIGGWINIDKISRYQSLQISENSTLYTAPFGTEISGFANLNWTSTQTSQSQLSAWMGTGIGLSIYAASNSDSKFQWLVALQNMNFDIYGGVSSISAIDSIVIKGYEIDDLNNFNTSNNSPNIDSISSILATQRSHGRMVNFQSPAANIRLAYKLNEGVSIIGETTLFQQVLNPTAKLSALLDVRSWFKIEPSVRLTSSSTISPGLNLYFQNSESVRVVLKTEQFTNLLAPQASYSQYLFGALQFNF